MAKLTKVEYHYSDGTIHYILDQPDLEKLIKSFPIGVKSYKSSSLTTLRNKYFAWIAEIIKNTNLGYTKTELHAALKPMLLNKFNDCPQYFKSNVPTLSTKDLNTQGWVELLQILKVIALDIFKYNLKD